MVSCLRSGVLFRIQLRLMGHSVDDDAKGNSVRLAEELLEEVHCFMYLSSHVVQIELGKIEVKSGVKERCNKL